MIQYFTVELPTAGSFADADRVADVMRVAIARHDVRLLPVRKLADTTFLFAYSARRAVKPQAIVTDLRKHPGFANCRIGDEQSSAGIDAIARPSKPSRHN